MQLSVFVSKHNLSLFLRVSGKEEVYILEVNSFCSFGPLSLVPKIAKKVGISHPDLYKTLLHNAALRGTKKTIEN